MGLVTVELNKRRGIRREIVSLQLKLGVVDYYLKLFQLTDVK